MNAIVVVDGEHYPPVVRDALAALPYSVIGVWLVGGTEKLRGDVEYGVPIVDGFDGAEVVVDLSDEPVLSPQERFLLASRVLAHGIPYEGAGFRFEPATFEPFPLPSVAVIGTGKRVGKTAVAGHVARRLARDSTVVVVAMGRGGPRDPEVIETVPTVQSLLELSRAGRHAASDHLETALAAGVTTIGCRRAGGGLAGAVTFSNVREGARIAARRNPDVVVFDGSGAAIPPIEVDRRILVVGAGQDATAYLNAYRLLISDLVVVLGETDTERIRSVKDLPVVSIDLRLRPLEPLRGRRTAVFTAGPASTDHLDADVVFESTQLADRARLRQDLARVDADVYLVELKAAAIDVVAESAAERGIDVVLAVNDVVSDELDRELERVVPVGAVA
jgi:cyclic 2,3-diphosphoglycerate synthetase